MKRVFAGLAVASLALLCAGSVQAAPIIFDYGATVGVPGDDPGGAFPIAPYTNNGAPRDAAASFVFYSTTNGSGTSTLRLTEDNSFTRSPNTLDASGPGTDITVFFPAYNSSNTNINDPNIFDVMPVNVYLTVQDDATGMTHVFNISGELKSKVSVGQANDQTFTVLSGIPSGPVLIGSHFYNITLPSTGDFSGAGGAHQTGDPTGDFGNEGAAIFHVQASDVPEPGTVTLLSGLAVPGLLLVARRRKR
jgi:hypothetical protein